MQVGAGAIVTGSSSTPDVPHQAGWLISWPLASNSCRPTHCSPFGPQRLTKPPLPFSQSRIEPEIALLTLAVSRYHCEKLALEVMPPCITLVLPPISA